ncbi:PD-(D/E)XK nuclease family protein, partial [bacterium]
MRISYSSLENFKQCPLKYKFSQIDKIKEPKSKEAIFGTY